MSLVQEKVQQGWAAREKGAKQEAGKLWVLDQVGIVGTH